MQEKETDEAGADARPNPPHKIPPLDRTSNDETHAHGEHENVKDVTPPEPAPPPTSRIPVVTRRRRKPPEVPSSDAYSWLIHRTFLKRNSEATLRLVDHILSETGGMCEYALFIKATLLRQQGDLHASLSLFQRAMQLNPINKENAIQVAHSLFLMGRHRAAIDVYKQILALGVEDWKVLHNQGVCYALSNQHAEAAKIFERTLALRKNERTYLQLARSQLKLGRPEDAMRTLETALELSPESIEVLTTLALLNLDMGNSGRSFTLFGTALTYDPTEPSAIVGAGAVVQEAEEYDVALTKYRIAAVRSPESGALWNNIGMCFFGKKKLVAALACLKRAVYLQPFEWQINFNLALLHLGSEQFVSAFLFASAAINLQPKFAQSYLLLGVALIHLEDLPNATLTFQKALQLDDSDPLIHANLALALVAEGDVSTAMREVSIAEGKVLDAPEESQETLKLLLSQLGAAIQLGPAATTASRG